MLRLLSQTEKKTAFLDQKWDKVFKMDLVKFVEDSL